MGYSCCNAHNAADVLGPLMVIMLIFFGLFVFLVILTIKAIVYCKIFHKAGYHWALGLLVLVPIACIIMPFVLAFGHWPIEKELKRLRQQQESAST